MKYNKAKIFFSLSTCDIIDNGASYCLEGGSHSIITSGKSRSLSSSTTILFLFDSGEICFGVALLSNENLSNLCHFFQWFNIFSEMSLNMLTVLFVISVSG